MASSSSYNSPCAACKFLRRKCMPGCIFAPYFPPEEPQKFANVHKIFGASNVTKLLNELLPHQREDAVERLQKELDAANADLIRYACNEMSSQLPSPSLVRSTSRRIGNEGGGSYFQNPGYSHPYSLPWDDNPSGNMNESGGGGGGGSMTTTLLSQ
ncbi:unnamed protein product, partial [Vitis vinifera]